MKGTIKVMGHDIELDMADKAAQLIQEEIDWELICDMMVACGWTRVETTWSCQSAEDAYDLKEWCSKNIEDHYKARGKTWVFAKEKDAVMFLLKWSK